MGNWIARRASFVTVGLLIAALAGCAVPSHDATPPIQVTSSREYAPAHTATFPTSYKVVDLGPGVQPSAVNDSEQVVGVVDFGQNLPYPF